VTQVLSGIAGIGIYPTFSLCLFFGLFVGMLWRVSRLRSHDLVRFGALPLDDEPVTSDDGRERS
jgi:hypothetical protein